jgi:phage terminase large subunit-like protein
MKIHVRIQTLEEYHAQTVSYDEEIYDNITRENISGQFTGIKKKVVDLLMDGENFYQISKKLDVDKNTIYNMRDELKEDLMWIYDDSKRQKYLDETRGDLGEFASNIGTFTKNIGLTDFASVYINDYNPEARAKNWNRIPLQDCYYQVWETYPKSIIKAPREHLKTTSVCEYIVKKIVERTYPLNIVYFHLTRDIAVSKVRDIQMMAERNPILSANFMIDQAKNWKDGELRLLDGSTISANGYLSGSVGKHPHIIILDDIIDQEVIYSDVKNDRAIRKFYSDIYPMITDASYDKKIIAIGTAQRADDIYEKLPDDFHKLTLKAVLDEANQVVLEPALFSFPKLMKVKNDMSSMYGEKYWLKEYMNAPFEAMGEIIRPNWIKYYQQAPEGLDIYDGWDLSVGKDLTKGDFTAHARIGIRKVAGVLEIYVLAIFHDRIDFAERLKKINEVATDGGSPLAIGVEENTFQYDTVSTLKNQTNLPIVGIKTLKNKTEKFQVELAPHFENGKVFIKPDMEELRSELLSLPYGKHDDMCDALTIAIQLSNSFGGEPIIDFL